MKLKLSLLQEDGSSKFVDIVVDDSKADDLIMMKKSAVDEFLKPMVETLFAQRHFEIMKARVQENFRKAGLGVPRQH